ncbi:MAG: antitoxin [Thermodesulfobacteriota bacterium]
MRPGFDLLKADILAELGKIDQLAAEFSLVEGLLDRAVEEVSNYDRGAIGYLLHSFYNGVERIFRAIALFFENELEPQTWHKDLLKRMTLEIPGFRPRVIDPELYRLLDDFRGFRHIFRHSYSFELDWEREKLVAKRFVRTSERLKKNINEFLDSLDQFEEGLRKK